MDSRRPWRGRENRINSIAVLAVMYRASRNHHFEAQKVMTIELLARPRLRLFAVHNLFSVLTRVGAVAAEQNDLQRATFRLSHGPGSALPDQAGQKLALWTILLLRWPLLTDHLQVYPEGVDWIGGVTQDESLLPVDPNLRALFELPEVRRVVKGEEVSVSLDAGSIRAFTGVLGVSKSTVSSSNTEEIAKEAVGPPMSGTATTTTSAT